MNLQTLQQNVATLESSLNAAPPVLSASTWIAMSVVASAIVALVVICLRERRGHSHLNLGITMLVTFSAGAIALIMSYSHDKTGTPLPMAWQQQYHPIYAELSQWSGQKPHPAPNRHMVQKAVKSIGYEVREIERLKRATEVLGIATNLADMPMSQRQMLLAQLAAR